ncbi:MAG: WG repeat-containing protein, partial [Ferruginibacter sp.]
MKVFSMSVWCLLVFTSLQAQQKFTLNKLGLITEAQWQTIKKSRQYEALSRFDTVSKKPLLVYAIYVKNNKLGIVNHLGVEVTPALYDDISGLNISYTTVMFGFHNHYPVVIDKKYGLITNTGKVILPVKYNYITYEKSKDNPKAGVVIDSTFMVND